MCESCAEVVRNDSASSGLVSGQEPAPADGHKGFAPHPAPQVPLARAKKRHASKEFEQR